MYFERIITYHRIFYELLHNQRRLAQPYEEYINKAWNDLSKYVYG